VRGAHGGQVRYYPAGRAKHAASFAAAEQDGILGVGADGLHRIVDLMRELRASRARRHVREEIPFFTGRSHSVAELLSLWP
jgi:chlorite dismutase